MKDISAIEFTSALILLCLPSVLLLLRAPDKFVSGRFARSVIILRIIPLVVAAIYAAASAWMSLTSGKFMPILGPNYFLYLMYAWVFLAAYIIGYRHSLKNPQAGTTAVADGPFTRYQKRAFWTIAAIFTAVVPLGIGVEVGWDYLRAHLIFVAAGLLVCTCFIYRYVQDNAEAINKYYEGKRSVREW